MEEFVFRLDLRPRSQKGSPLFISNLDHELRHFLLLCPCELVTLAGFSQRVLASLSFGEGHTPVCFGS